MLKSSVKLLCCSSEMRIIFVFKEWGLRIWPFSASLCSWQLFSYVDNDWHILYMSEKIVISLCVRNIW